MINNVEFVFYPKFFVGSTLTHVLLITFRFQIIICLLDRDKMVVMLFYSFVSKGVIEILTRHK